MIKEVKRIANLAKLNISDEEIDQLADEFKRILGFIDQLSKVDVENIKPFYELNTTNHFRDDKVIDQHGRKVVESLAPSEYNGQFVVPRILQNG